jgi:hypothetical protein
MKPVIFSETPGKLTYQITTLPGQSGSPVTIEDNIIAIHVGSDTLKEVNIGCLLTPKVVKDLRLWCKELKADSLPYNWIAPAQSNHYFTNQFLDEEQTDRLIDSHLT